MNINWVNIGIGILFVALGVGLVIKTRYFVQNFGANAWAEDKFGAGGSNTLYNLIGLALIFIGFTLIFDLWDNLLGFVLGPLVGAGRQ